MTDWYRLAMTSILAYLIALGQYTDRTLGLVLFITFVLLIIVALFQYEKATSYQVQGRC